MALRRLINADLTPAQEQVLWLLMCRRWVTRKDIEEVVWPARVPDYNAVGRHLRNLSKKLGPLGWAIQKNKGGPYRLIRPEEHPKRIAGCAWKEGPAYKLTPEQRAEVRRMYRAGLHWKNDIGPKFDIGDDTLRRILREPDTV